MYEQLLMTMHIFCKLNKQNNPIVSTVAPLSIPRSRKEMKGVYYQNPHVLYMGFTKNSGTYLKSSILIGFSIINHPFWGTPIFGNTHIPDLSEKQHCQSWTSAADLWSLRSCSTPRLEIRIKSWVSMDKKNCFLRWSWDHLIYNIYISTYENQCKSDCYHPLTYNL